VLNSNKTPRNATGILSIFFLLLLVFSQCKKEYSYEGGQEASDAVYSIRSDQNSCSGTIGGSYTAGIQMNASNTYTLFVNVVTPGKYSISTQTANGIIFNATGEFINPGDQNITLTASGTPTMVGNFTMTPEILGPSGPVGNGCDFVMAVK
jgi:hypothetical protein